MTPTELPEFVSPYKRTPTFTKSSCPKGLLARHNTKKDTWGLIVIESGCLRYTIFNETGPDWATILTPDKPGIIEPQIFHKVELLSDDSSFYVEFYAREGGDIGLPKFMKEGDVSDVGGPEDNSLSAKGIGSRWLLVPLACMGVIGYYYCWRRANRGSL